MGEKGLLRTSDSGQVKPWAQEDENDAASWGADQPIDVEQEVIMLSVVGNAWQRVVMVEEVDRSQMMGLVSTVLKFRKCSVER